MMRRWFDVHVYTGFWSVRILMIRLPQHLFDAEAAKPFTSGESFGIEKAGSNVVLVFQDCEMEIDGADDGYGWLAALAPVRAGLMEGDRRCLYLAWLLAVQNGVVEDDDIEPLRPPGLGRLDSSLKTFADFFAIDPDLLTAAAGDDGLEGDPLTPDTVRSFIDALPSSEKTALLVRVVLGEVTTLYSELRRRCRDAMATAHAVPPCERRRVGDLRRAAEALGEARRLRAAKRAAVEQACREREAADARSRRLDALARRGETAWREVEELIDACHAISYDQAVALLEDLRALADRAGTGQAFRGRVMKLRGRHARKRTLIMRLDRAGLPN